MLLFIFQGYFQVITDAGALNPKGLSEAVDALLKSKGHKLRVRSNFKFYSNILICT